MQLEHYAAAGCLVEPVDILRDDGSELSRFFHLGKLQMSLVWLCIGVYHPLEIEFPEYLRPFGEESVGEHCFGRIIESHAEQSAFTAEIGYPAFGGHPGSAEEYRVLRIP